MARFAPTLTLYGDGTGDEVLAAAVPRHPYSEPRLSGPPADDGRTRVSCNLKGYSVGVFVEPKDILPVVTEFVLATPARSPGDPRIGVSLVPGDAVEVQETVGEQVRVVLEDRELAVQGGGWIPRRVIGRMYRQPDVDPRKAPPGQAIDLAWSEQPIPVRDAPNGGVFATFRGHPSFHSLAETRDGHVLGAVNFYEHASHVVGWIPESAVVPRTNVLGGVLADPQDPNVRRIPVTAGTRLRSESGRDIGVVVEHTRLDCLADCESATPQVRLRCVGEFPARAIRPQ